MATRVELSTADIARALTLLENSLKRSLNTPQNENPLMKEIINKDIMKLSHAKISMTEIK